VGSPAGPTRLTTHCASADARGQPLTSEDSRMPPRRSSEGAAWAAWHPPSLKAPAAETPPPPAPACAPAS
jgi:hypothetical protein